MGKKLSDILLKLDQSLIKRVKGYLDVEVLGLTYNSEFVLPKIVFFALPGLHFDGHEFIELAIQKGSNVIIHVHYLNYYNPNVTYIEVNSCVIKRVMSNFANFFYDEPSKKLKVVGVTGTDGKSSVCYYIYTLLREKGIKVGLVSTVFIDNGNGVLKKNLYRQSTPESTEIHFLLSEMVTNNVKYVILESTSHGLDPDTSRLVDISYFAAVFTNISHEHLEFHGTMQNYLNAKLSLFRSISSNGFGVINFDDTYSFYFLNVLRKSFTYSLKSHESDFFVSYIKEEADFTEFEFFYQNRKYDVKVNLIGSFNVENVMAALILVSQITNTDLQDIVNILKCIKSLYGRMDSIKLGQSYSVIIDYAHTPGSFTRLFPIFRRLAKNRLISLFGSAGERDSSKRFLQGKISDSYSDVIILCDEDPRGEDSMCIIEDIAKGITNKVLNENLFFIPNRRQAIKKAINLAMEGDLVVTLGKGHENSIIYKGKNIIWDEKTEVRNAILNLEKEEA